MIRSSPFVVLLALLLGGCLTPAPPLATNSTITPEPAPIRYEGAVSSADPRADRAGQAMLAQGGSATDAAIAIMLALTVVEPQSSGIGGGGFLVRAGAQTSEADVVTIDGRETAPVTATPARFLNADGEPMGFDQRVTSGLSVGVPGNIALAAEAHARYGKLPWETLFAPAITLARDGFRINRRLHDSLLKHSRRGGATSASRAVFYDANGRPLRVGARVTIPELADTLEDIAADGLKALYDHRADDLADYVARETPGDGTMTATDVRAYVAKMREPVCTPYRSYRICGMGPPSSGGIAVAQILGQLEPFDLTALGPQSATFWHLFLESQRLAYADRARYLADSDFMSVPIAGLVDPAYLARRSALIDPNRALGEARPGMPPGTLQAQADGEEGIERGTSHFAVVDGAGNAVSYTSTIEGPFGSGLYFEGFYLNNELTDFSASPEENGMPVANRVEGGKRPRSSMSPTIVFDSEGNIVLVIGAAGGTTIPVQVARSIIGVIDFDMSAQEALGLPLLIAFGPVVVTEEGGVVAGMLDAFNTLGHKDIRVISPRGKANALLRTRAGWESAADPRIAEMLDYE